MSASIYFRTAPPIRRSGKWHPHVRGVETCLMISGGERKPEIIWEAPTDDEWRRAVRVIAEHVAVRLAGYRDHDEFARDGCRFVKHVFETDCLRRHRPH